MAILYLILALFFAVVGYLFTQYYGKLCVRYEEVEVNSPLIILIGFFFIMAGTFVCKIIEMR